LISHLATIFPKLILCTYLHNFAIFSGSPVSLFMFHTRKVKLI
jgi:hypothetical protein